jgi:hypothetical protein
MDRVDIPRECPLTPHRARNRLWMLYFLVLALLSVVAVVVPIVYNLGLQLRPEQLAEARRHWAEAGPADYDLWIERRTTNPAGETHQEGFVVHVRGGIVASPDGHSDTVEGLFEHIAANLAADAARTDRRNYATASFASTDGHPTRYVHRSAGSKEREEWLIRLALPGEP